jgi:hypothetical protein
MRSLAKFLVLAVVALALFPPTVRATQILYKSLPQLGEQSEAVVRGNVVGIESYWNEKRTKIFTETVLAITESYKGEVGSSARILQLGGVVDNVRVTVHGALNWDLGEEVVVFLEPAPAGKYQVSGFSQGKFKVVRDPRTNEAFIIQPDLADVQLVGAPESVSPTTGLEKVPLTQFIERALGNRQRDEQQ